MKWTRSVCLVLGVCGAIAACSSDGGGGGGGTGGTATGGTGATAATGGTGNVGGGGTGNTGNVGGGTGGSSVVLPAGCVNPSLTVQCNPLTSAECDSSTEACDLGSNGGENGFFCFSGNTEAPGAPCDNANGPWCVPTYHCSPAPATTSDAGTGGSAGSAGAGATDASTDGAAGAAGAAPDSSVPDAAPTGGSCVGHCGSSDPVPGSSPECYCDDACESPQNNDCCADKQTACPKPPSTGVCQKFCCAASDCGSGETCQAFDATTGTIGTCVPQ